jgi:hypothetical protein
MCETTSVNINEKIASQKRERERERERKI